MPHWYCVEFGGTIVLNIDIVSAPQAQSQPLSALRLLLGTAAELANPALQAWRLAIN